VATVAAKWNVDAQDEPEPLQVTARWASEDGGSGLQETMKVRACASPREEVTDETRSLLAGYHILSVGLFSGYSARESTIVAEGFEKLVMRTEQSSGALEVYLDNLPEGGVCVTFVAQRDHMVEMVQPVASAVFDYYEPGRRGEVILQASAAVPSEGVVTTSASPSTTRDTPESTTILASGDTTSPGSDSTTSASSGHTTEDSVQSTTVDSSAGSSTAPGSPNTTSTPSYSTTAEAWESTTSGASVSTTFEEVLSSPACSSIGGAVAVSTMVSLARQLL